MFFPRPDPPGNTVVKRAAAGDPSPPAKKGGAKQETPPAAKPDDDSPAARDQAMEQDRQADTLEAAAEEGVPFCEECEQAKADKSAQAERQAAERR